MEEIIIYAILLIVGGVAGGLLTATALRKAVLKKSEIFLVVAK